MILAIRDARFLAVAAILALTTAAFWPGLGGGFLFDDYPNIIEKQSIHASALTLEELSKAANAYVGPVGRPIATMSFAVDHAIGGLDPYRYKLTGLLVHLLNSALVFLLALRLLPLGRSRHASGVTAAFAISAIWALHPLQVSTVLYVVQRMETLSLTFVLLALLAYLRGRLNQANGVRAWPWLAACVPLVLLGVLAKETAILFPAFTLALELTVLNFAAGRESRARAWRLAYAAGVVLALILFAAIALPHYLQPEVYAVRDFTMAERLLTQLRAVPMYLGWILLPNPGSYHFYYDNFPVSEGLLSPATTLLGALVLAALALVAAATRRVMPLVSLGLLWFLAAHLLTSNVAHLELVFEHRNYFAIFGVVIAIAGLLQRLPVSDAPRVRKLGMAVLILGALGLTLIRSAIWGDPMTLASYLADRNPGSSRASTDLGEQYMLLANGDPGSRFYGMAEKEFERGSRVPNASPMPEQGLVVLAATAGQPAKSEWWDRMVSKLKTRAIGPQELSMITGLLRLRNDGLELDDARFAEAYSVLADRLKMPPTQYYAFGQHALRLLGDETLANGLLRQAVDNAASQPELIAAMAEALVRDGFIRQARLVADHARESGFADIDLSGVPRPAAGQASDPGQSETPAPPAANGS